MRGAAAAALLAAAAYRPALSNGFVNWDDVEILLSNPNIRGFDPGRLKWMFTSLYMNTYQPLGWLGYALVYRLQGLSPFGFHAASVVLHAANAAVFCLLIRRLLDAAGFKKAELAAFGGAAAFALHPLQVENVAWAMGFSDLLATLFFQGALLAYLARRRTAGWALFLLSALSRWRGIGLPAVLLVLDVYPLRRSLRDPRVWREKLPYFAVAAGLLLVNAAAKFREVHYALRFRPIEAAAGLLFYLGKLAAPADLIPIYRLDAGPHPAAGVAAALALTAALVLARRKWPAGLAAWACFAVSLAPRLVAAPPGHIFLHDQYAYQAGLGFFVLFAGLLARASRVAASAILLVVLPMLGFLARRQIPYWHDSIRLWTHALEADPASSAAHTNLGEALLREGRAPEAFWHFREDLRNNPQDAVSRINMGRFLTALGRPKIDWAEWHNNLGADLFDAGEDEEALWHLTRAAALNPRLADVHDNLGMVLARRGRKAEAAGHFQAALRLKPDDERARRGLAALGTP